MILIIGGSHQGKSAFARQLAKEGDNLVLHYHNTLRRAFQEGKDTDEETRKLLREKPDIVTMDEVGCGIVPLEQADRDFRDAAGHAGQLLAKEAEAVYRVVCGIPARIK